MLEIHSEAPACSITKKRSVDFNAMHRDDENLLECPQPAHERNFASNSMRTMPRYFSTAKLSQKAKSEKFALSSKHTRHTSTRTGQSEERLVAIFEADRKAGEFNELDPLKIFENEARLTDSSTFVMSNQSLQDLQASLSQILPADEAPEYHLEGTTEEEETNDENGGRKRVRFAEISIREYPMVLGDNPGGCGGPPVSIGWQYFPFADVDLDRYESARDGFRRRSEEMRMTADHRFDLLTRTGFHVGTILAAAKEAERVRRRRMSTVCKLGWIERDAFIESLGRKWKNLLSLGRLRREEKEYLAPYVPSSSLPSKRAKDGK